MISLNKLSFGFLNDTKTFAINAKVNELKELDLNKIIQVDFPENQYYKEQTDKKQLVLHHTVSGQGVNGDIAWWRSTSDRIATAIIIDWKGDIYQCFSSRYWGHHLGIKNNPNNVNLNKGSIGIEIDSWGGLIKHKNKWYPAVWDVNLKKNIPNLRVNPITNIVEYPDGYRGHYAYEKYTDEQIESVRKLILYWHDIYKIPLDYNEDMWDVSQNALNGKAGIWTHNSYRLDKSDCHKQIELIEMLKSLK